VYNFIEFRFTSSSTLQNHRVPNGWRYPLVGGRRQRRFDGNTLAPAYFAGDRLHAVLGAL